MVKGPLIDSTGSVVDAIGIPDLVQLDQQRWEVLFSSTDNLYYLIFHEMLRSASYDDDNFKISFIINTFFSDNNPPVKVGDLSKMTFTAIDDKSNVVQSFQMVSASATIFRNKTSGELQMGIGFSEFSLSVDPCVGGGMTPSDENPKNRLMTIYNIALILGTKQNLKPYEGDLTKETAPNGRIVAFNKESDLMYYHLGAFGQVTLLALTDNDVTLHIDHFSSSGPQPFTMDGTATLKICH